MTQKPNSPLSRWLLPVVISLLAIAVLRQQSEEPIFFSRYDWGLLLFFLLNCCWAAESWWIASNSGRSERFLIRIGRISSGLPVFLLLVGLALFDFFTPAVEILLVGLSEHVLLFMALGIILMMLAMLIFSGVNPRNALQDVLVGLISTAVAIFGAELLFRYVLVEYHVPRTEEGFQQHIASSWPHPVAVEKPDGVYRLLGLADSFGTNGGKHNYQYVLEERLQEINPEYEIVNLSHSAYELPEELELFSRFGTRYHPDLVLHGVFVGNDFWGKPGNTALSYRGISLVLEQGLSSWRPGNFLLRSWFANYAILVRDTRKKEREKIAGKEVGGMSETEFLRIERQRLDICHTSLTSDDEPWETVSSLLDQIYEETRRIGAQYVIVIHPDQFQVERGLLQQLGQTFKLNPQFYDLEQPQRFLQAYCRSRGIPCLDLLPVFRQNGRNGGLYLLRNTHYNEQGNHLAADHIFQFLQEHVFHKE